ncbi:hypothetical protein Vadar_013109 [Vaccinium darrowii]|uniref:Uncharacterized protein n=1 Tax=Vaccinium darrowii TaxID=229202 RepID=A0ACB7ZB68_9ERIC|nr:hypothetical protein Vadar_013109 [Vaccinium darrowii]
MKAMVAPSSAKQWQTARPIPESPPVTISSSYSSYGGNQKQRREQAWFRSGGSGSYQEKKACGCRCGVGVGHNGTVQQCSG